MKQGKKYDGSTLFQLSDQILLPLEILIEDVRNGVMALELFQW